MWILLDVVFFELDSPLLIELVWIDSLILIYRAQEDRYEASTYRFGYSSGHHLAGWHAAATSAIRRAAASAWTSNLNFASWLDILFNQMFQLYK